MRTLVMACLLAALTAAGGEDFRREGKPEQRKLKDPLEGKAPPKLDVKGWMNVKDPKKGLALKDFKGKVVVLKFWGVW